MKHLKKCLTLALTALLVLSVCIPALATVEDTGFSGVAASAWYAEAVMYCREHNLMAGIGNNQFAPKSNLTRAQLAAVLYRIEGTPAVTGTHAFTDTPDGAVTEQHDPSVRPAITNSVANMEQYDIVFIGYPIWVGQAPQIVSTFLEGYDFGGKTIVPFCTSNSSGMGSSAQNLHSLTNGANWLDGQRFSGGTSRNAMVDWVNSLELDVTAS